MPTIREIRTKIGSIKNTQKITKAMQLMAATKIRKAQQMMLASMPYAEKVRAVIGHVSCSHSEFRNPYLEVRQEVKCVGLIIISSDRGLCGGLNANLFRKLINEDIKNWSNKKVGMELCLVGKKAVSFFKRSNLNIAARTEKVSKSKVSELIGAIKTMLDLYVEKKIDQLFIAYNKYVNSMIQKPVIQPLLPLILNCNTDRRSHWDYIYEPDADKLLNLLLKRYIESQVYQAMVDNNACEQAARMMAMRNATDNASMIIDDLQLVYNKNRQAIITREMSEIIAGAEAV